MMKPDREILQLHKARNRLKHIMPSLARAGRSDHAAHNKILWLLRHDLQKICPGLLPITKVSSLRFHPPHRIAQRRAVR